MTPLPPTLGAYLRRCRGETSQVALADALGVTQPTISRWERDEVAPTLAQLHQLAALLPSFLVPVAASYEPPTRETDR